MRKEDTWCLVFGGIDVVDVDYSNLTLIIHCLIVVSCVVRGR